MLVVAGLVAILRVCPRAAGVESRRVGCFDAGDVEVVDAAAGGAARGEIGDVPGQGGTVLGPSGNGGGGG